MDKDSYLLLGLLSKSATNIIKESQNSLIFVAMDDLWTSQVQATEICYQTLSIKNN